jgi:hypothetical protein
MWTIFQNLFSMITQNKKQKQNRWNQFACEINEELVLEQAHKMVELKLNEVGYEYVNVDDCWQAETRDSEGRLQPDPVRFPRGIKWLSGQIHDLGLKFGIYTCIGTHTCEGLPGSYDHYEIDAKTFAEWNVDFVKVDTCSLTMEQNWDPEPFYEEFAGAIEKESSKILYSVCNWGIWEVTFFFLRFRRSILTSNNMPYHYHSAVEMGSTFLSCLAHYNGHLPSILESTWNCGLQ